MREDVDFRGRVVREALDSLFEIQGPVIRVIQAAQIGRIHGAEEELLQMSLDTSEVLDRDSRGITPSREAVDKNDPHELRVGHGLPPGKRTYRSGTSGECVAIIGQCQ